MGVSAANKTLHHTLFQCRDRAATGPQGNMGLSALQGEFAGAYLFAVHSTMTQPGTAERSMPVPYLVPPKTYNAI